MSKSSGRRKGMPSGMYIGGAWIGFALLMGACWILILFQSEKLLAQGLGNAGNYRIILNVVAIFGFALPLLIGIRIMRRAGKQVRLDQDRQS